MNHRCRVLLLPLLLAAAVPLSGQSTTPHSSSYFGGSGSDELVVVRRGPGGLITLIGHSDSPGLATPGALQPAIAGNRDAFVARLDPSLPPNLQLQWRTYLGGSGLDLVFDAEVDPRSGVTTLVGLTRSPTFPGAGAPGGAADGFVAQIAADGSALVFSMLIGGALDERICEVEVDTQGIMTIAGVVEGPNSLPAATNAYRGSATDAFVARIAPSSSATVLWSTHLGGSNTEGMTFSAWQSASLWWGNLDRMALTLDPGGDAVLATTSFRAATPAVTTCPSPHAGLADVYLPVLDAQGALRHGAYFGGNSNDHPNAIAPHPSGGFVIGGVTWSTTLPATPNCLQPTLAGGGSAMGGASDGFLCWLDPSLCGPNGRRYATYLGGNVGQDVVFALATESSGIVTVAGLTAGGTFPVTPRCLQPTLAPGQFGGHVARIAMDGNGAADLQYSTFVGAGAFLQGLVLDELGDAWCAGVDWTGSHPVVNARQPFSGGGRDGTLMHLPLLPGGVSRQTLLCAAPTCGAPLYTSAGGAPLPGTTFVLRAANAPPSALGVVLIGLPAPTCRNLFNAQISVSPFVAISTPASQLGAAEYPLWVPATLPPLPSYNLAAQWVFVTNGACPGSGLLGASERLAF